MRNRNTRTGAHARGASGDDHGKFAHTPFGFPEPQEVIERHQQLLDYFQEVHTEHVRPYDPAEGFRPHTRNTCPHLFSEISSAHPSHLPNVIAFIFGGNPQIKLCTTCARQAKKVERRACHLCGHDTFTQSKLRRRSYVGFIEVHEAPLSLLIAACERCWGIVTLHDIQRRTIGPPTDRPASLESTY